MEPPPAAPSWRSARSARSAQRSSDFDSHSEPRAPRARRPNLSPRRRRRPDPNNLRRPWPPSATSTRPPTIASWISAERYSSTPTCRTLPGTSCASCHDPAHGFAGNNGSTAGVAKGSRPGHFARRNTPSVLYLRFVPRFHFHWEEDVALPDGVGGFFWDGRTDSLAALVRQPLFNPDEMNAGERAPGPRQDRGGLLRRRLSSRFRRRARRSRTPRSPRSERPSRRSSAATRWRRSRPSTTTTSAAAPSSRRSKREASGCSRTRAKGACDACHKLNDASPVPERSLFTDYGFEAVGVPRNRHISGEPRPALLRSRPLRAARSPSHGRREVVRSLSHALACATSPCAQAFMHNGAFSTLRDVVAFYATRGTDPKRWYASGRSFDDLPQQYRENVNAIKRALRPRAGGKAARWTTARSTRSSRSWGR